MTTTIEQTAISLETGCDHPSCAEIAFPLHKQLTEGDYRLCSVLAMPETVEQWRAAHRTARKRADRAARLGYRFELIDRRDYQDDIYQINTSAPARQGRPMTAGYWTRPVFGENPLICDRHHVYTYGVLTGSRLVAYLWLYRAGQLALVSSILGHADHLAGDVMYLLVQGVIDDQADEGGFLCYNRHDSGTDGLRYFKERLGLTETVVEWLL